MDELPELTDEEKASLGELSGTEGGKDKCWLAMKAAWDTLSEYCGSGGVQMEIEGMSLTVPVDVIEAARSHPDMSRDERVNMVAYTEWCRGTAMSMCEDLFGAERGTTMHNECLESVALRIASKIID